MTSKRAMGLSPHLSQQQRKGSLFRVEQGLGLCQSRFALSQLTGTSLCLGGELRCPFIQCCASIGNPSLISSRGFVKGGNFLGQASLGSSNSTFSPGQSFRYSIQLLNPRLQRSSRVVCCLLCSPGLRHHLGSLFHNLGTLKLFSLGNSSSLSSRNFCCCQLILPLLHPCR